jgi:acyl CoA:acetate/3-ketoacid CoA transferase
VSGAEQLTFNGEAAVKKGQKAIYVTERGALCGERDGIALVVAAPGPDLKKDLLAHVEFPARVSPGSGRCPRTCSQPDDRGDAGR